MSDLMVIKSGSGRQGKCAGIEQQILAELESGNYRTRQEIADMIENKFHVKVSRSCLWIRVWKFVKGEISSKYYDNFDTFKQTIDSIISSTDGENKPKINRLIGKGVQLFYNLVPVGENTFAFLCDRKLRPSIHHQLISNAF